LGYFFHTTTRDIGHLSAQEIARGKELIGNSQYPIVQVLSPPPEGLFFHAYAAVPCQEIIAQEAVNSGYFNAFPDTDGVIRRAPLVVKFDDEYYFPLSIAILLQYFDSPPIKLKLSEIGVEEITIENSRIPVDESGRLLINLFWAGAYLPPLFGNGHHPSPPSSGHIAKSYRGCWCYGDWHLRSPGYPF